MKKPIYHIILVACSVLNAQVPTSGLLGYYPFIGNAADASGNGNNGTVLGATLTADRFGNPNCAYRFNGVSDYISLPTTPFIGLNVYSYSLWFKPASSTNNGRIICIGENGGLCQSLTRQTSGSVFASSFNAGNNPSLSYAQSQSLANNQWYNVVVARDGFAVKMYLNGALISSATPTATNGQPADYGSVLPQRALIGARSSLGATFFFDGTIDDIRIYNVALNSSEVLSLYNELPCYLPVPVSSSPGNTICSGNSVTLSTTASGTVSWFGSPSGTNALSSATLFSTPVLTASSGPATYTYYAEVNTCTLYPRTAMTITVNPLPQLSVNASGSTSCAGESVTLTAQGASGYSWMPNAFTFSILPVVVISPNATTTYTLLGTDGNGCSNALAYSQSVTSCLALNDEYGENAVHLFPDPVKDVLNISGISFDNAALEIYDGVGRLVRRLTLDGGRIDIHDLGITGICTINVYRNGTLVLKQKVAKE